MAKKLKTPSGSQIKSETKSQLKQKQSNQTYGKPTASISRTKAKTDWNNPYNKPVAGRPKVSLKVGKAMDAVSKYTPKTKK